MPADFHPDSAHSAIANITLATRLRDENQTFSKQDRAMYDYVGLHPDKTFAQIYEHGDNKTKFNHVDKTNIPDKDFNPRIQFYDGGGEPRWMFIFGKGDALDTKSGMQLGLCTLIEVLRQTDAEIMATSPEELAKIDVYPVVYPHFEDIGRPGNPSPVPKAEKSHLIYFTKEQYARIHQTVEAFLDPNNRHEIH